MEDNYLWIVLEYADQVDLDQFIKKIKNKGSEDIDDEEKRFELYQDNIQNHVESTAENAVWGRGERYRIAFSGRTKSSNWSKSL